MKRNVLCSLMLTGLLATGGALYAQDTAPPPPDQNAQAGGPPPPHGKRMDPEKRLEHMTKRYKLTQDQQTQLKPILEDQQQQMMALRNDTSMSRDDKRAKMMSMRQEGTQKIEAVLNDEQKQKFEADQKKMEERMAQRMHEGAGGPPDDGGAPPPPQQQ